MMDGIDDKTNVMKVMMETGIVKLSIGGEKEIAVYLSDLRNPTLPVLEAMFSEKNNGILKYVNDSVLINADPKIFIPLIRRLNRPSIDLRECPEGITKEEWFAELDYWGVDKNSLSKVPLPGHNDYFYDFCCWLRSTKHFSDNFEKGVVCFEFLIDYSLILGGDEVYISSWLNSNNYKLLQNLKVFLKCERIIVENTGEMKRLKRRIREESTQWPASVVLPVRNIDTQPTTRMTIIFE